MEPEWTLPYWSENYTGPFLSDGKFHKSVANGKASPKSKLDRLSRIHDTAYALCKDAGCLRKADRAYHQATRSMSWFPRLAGDLVLYWNDPSNLFGVAGEMDQTVGENMSWMGETEGQKYLRRDNAARNRNFYPTGNIRPDLNNLTHQPQVVYDPVIGAEAETCTIYNPQGPDLSGGLYDPRRVGAAKRATGSKFQKLRIPYVRPRRKKRDL